jgi:hypothetical protein
MRTRGDCLDCDMLRHRAAQSAAKLKTTKPVCPTDTLHTYSGCELLCFNGNTAALSPWSLVTWARCNAVHGVCRECSRVSPAAAQRNTITYTINSGWNTGTTSATYNAGANSWDW